MPRHLSRSVGLWCWTVLVLIAAHDVTHIADEGLDTSVAQLALVAVPQWIAIGVIMAVILRAERRHSAIAAVLLGAGTALGFVLVHFLPFALAPFWDLEPSLASWLLAWVPTFAGVVLAALAWRELKGAPDRRPLTA